MSTWFGVTRQLLPSQDTAADAKALRAAGATQILDFGLGVERIKPAGTERSLLEVVGGGDVVIVTEPARLASSVARFTSIAAALVGAGARLQVQSEPALSVDFGDYDPGDVFRALVALRSRLAGLQTRAGMEAAAAQGRRLGRPSAISVEQLMVAQELRRQERSYAHIARVLGVSASAVQRALRTSVTR